MTDIVKNIEELKALPPDLHLFCPRVGDDDYSIYFDEDIAGLDVDDNSEERDTKIKEAQSRKWLTLNALTILAFDDAGSYRDWVTARLTRSLSTCEVCVRVFHQSRPEWERTLEEQFGEEEVTEFLKRVDDMCIERIKAGLAEATTVLQAAEPNSRSIRLVPGEGVYALFESLSCAAFFRNEELVQRHFDTPFDLVQTKKRLKLQTFVPTMSHYLFSKNARRRSWALNSWAAFRRNLLPSEFEWAVRDYLLLAMQRVQITALEVDFVPQFWKGIKHIIAKVDKELITHSIRGLDLNLYRLMLEHFQLNNTGLFDLLETMRYLLEKSAADFWDAMGAISPTVIVEQVLNSPVLKALFLQATEDEGHIRDLKDAFAWIRPFLSSIKPANMAPACRALAHQLLGRLQSDSFSRVSRAACFKEGLRVFDYALGRLGESKTRDTFVGQPIVDAMLDVLEPHIEFIVSSMKRFSRVLESEEYSLGLSMVGNAFNLECLSLDIERQCILLNQPSPTGPTASRPVWKSIIRSIDIENAQLATRLIISGQNLIGLEPFFIKPSTPKDKVSPAVVHFNKRFELLSQTITEVIELLNGFEAAQLDALLENPQAAAGVVATLFSSDREGRQATVEFLKVLSGADARREALRHVLTTFYKNSLLGLNKSCLKVIRKKLYTPTPSMIRVFSDVIDIMCNSQDGTLRSEPLSPSDAAVTLSLWRGLWEALTTIFDTTEEWSNMGYDKSELMDFCRDTMQFADQLFDQCSIFTTSLKESLGQKDLLKSLLSDAAKAMGGMKKWLRLRDEFLSSKSVSLISKLLTRLHEVAVELDSEDLSYIESVLSHEIRTKLSAHQQAELQRALEIHLGRPLFKVEEPEPVVKSEVKSEKQSAISKWMSTGKNEERKESKTHIEKTVASFRARQLAAEAKRKEEAQKQAELQAAKHADFKKKRELEKEAKKKRDAAIIAQTKKKTSALRGYSEHTAEAGSGLEGLGVLGKDHAAKGEGAFMSSDESSEEDELDRELFGIAKNKKPKVEAKTQIVNSIPIRMPVKKRRIVRSAQDMRARLAPDMTPLHKVILSWDYYHDGAFPPKSRPESYNTVPKVFRTAKDYQNTFEPLLTLEAWQGFVKAREENVFKPYEIRVVSRASVDAFQEVGSTMTHADNRELSLSEGDIVLLSKSSNPSAEDPHCLARVFRITRKKEHIEVSYRVMPSNPLQSSLIPKGTVYGAKIQSITPLEREYASLLGLQYYDLCDEIINAKPSPLLDYTDKHLDPLIKTYNVNKAQAKAVKSALDNDAFTLIQGPPGSGKTKTIVAIVGALLTDSFRNQGTAVHVPGQARSDASQKKLLVCAPSNAAVDELVMRFKQGVKTLGGTERKLNIVRMGRGDAINANVKDVTLEELVNAKLGLDSANGKNSEETKKIFTEHQNVSNQLREVRQQLDAGTAKGDEANKLKSDFDALRRRKTELGSKIDNLKDEERLASRAADLNRRRAQEAVLNNAHIICATLSGSGHEIFSNTTIEFETVVVDEAAQCVEMSALIPLKYGAAKCILVGDPKQLPPTVFSKEAARFQYEQSLFVRMQANHPKDVHLLDTQYRMHPEISLFPSRTFYDGKLLDGGDMAGLRQRPWHASAILGPYRFFDVQGQHSAAPQGHSLINIAEIEVAMQLFARLTSDYNNYNFEGKVGIITPYKSQLRELKNRFSRKYGERILETVEFNTTDAFQGRESEIIIFSCVRASPAGGIGFLQDIRRMNVGLTRAKSSLWVLGNSASLVRGQFWKQLIDDARSRDRYTQGNLLNMLRQHSNNFPAPKNLSVPRPQIKEIKQEPVKQEPVKKEPEPEMMEIDSGNDYNTTAHGKRKRDRSPSDDGRNVKSEEDSGVETSKSNTARSTPAIMSDEASKSPAPGIGIKPEVKQERKVEGVAALVQNRPKVIRRRPKEVDPFIRRPAPKRPKGS